MKVWVDEDGDVWLDHPEHGLAYVDTRKMRFVKDPGIETAAELEEVMGARPVVAVLR